MASFRSMLGLSPSIASTASSALIIIDAQNEHATGKLAVANVDASRAVIASLLGKYRAAKAPVFHVVHETPEGAPVFTPGTELAEEFSELTPKDGEPVIKKLAPGSFTGTNLLQLLQDSGKKQVVIVGYMAHVCISMTSRQASENGFDVIVVEDGVGDRDIPGVKADELKRVALCELADVVATVVQSKDIA
ncbi:isochorismatase hydrolase [Stachybotrys elegans]|uniref:Isochorismatase hydrolase n=1 Tax=Stachybotrys elegans TaxID=80388 RepID=A0A8K0WP89_9HYPO|nr:isochorismatase hydrolase [Stachybotrys elegans]